MRGCPNWERPLFVVIRKLIAAAEDVAHLCIILESPFFIFE
jgi:hypothetical protein